MNLEDRCSLSYYKPIASLDENHGVYLVQHTITGKIYVKKTIVEYEASVYRYLKANHIPNTPYIYELFEDDGCIVVIEEYISGSSLQSVLESKGPLPEHEAVDVLIKLCSIVDQLHHVNPPIIHRDIKPSNIMISQDGTVTLLDMDAAKWYKDQSGRDTKLIGTYGYAAPEQFGFGASDERTDIYSIGVLLNVMLTGVLPSQITAHGKLGGIIEKCTRLKPDERYASVSEMLRDLDERKIRTGDHYKGKRYVAFLPPGFRSLHPLKMIFSGLGYLVLILSAFLLNNSSATPAMVVFVRFFYILTGLAIIFLSSNYMGVKERLRIPKQTWKRVLITILLDLGLLVILLVIMGVAVK